MVGRLVAGLTLVALCACGDDGGAEGSGAGGSQAGGGSSTADTGGGGSGEDGPCREDIITFVGTADGQVVDLEMVVDGQSGEQIGDDKRWSYSFDGGHVGFRWSGDYLGAGTLLDATGTVVWAAQTVDDSRHCWEGTVQRVGDYDEIRILSMTEFIDIGESYGDPPICGDPVDGTIDVCVWNDAP
jgi:hypothetical protein